MTTTTTEQAHRYIVAKTEPGAYNIGTGNPVIVRTCGHVHRTLCAANHCHSNLTKRQPGGMYRADYWGAELLHLDGSRLTRDEIEQLHEIQMRAERA